MRDRAVVAAMARSHLATSWQPPLLNTCHLGDDRLRAVYDACITQNTSVMTPVK